MVQRQGGDLVRGALLDEPAQRGAVALRLRLARGDAVAEHEPGQVHIEKRTRIGVAAVKAHEVLVEKNRLERRRVGFARGGAPRHERVAAVEDRILGADLERILGPRAGLLARRVESERLMRDEIVGGGPVRVRQRSFLDEIVKRSHGRPPQRVRSRERAREPAIDLAEEPREIPRGEIVAGRLAGCGALQETPAVVLVVLSEPDRLDRPEQRLHRGRRPIDLGFDAPDLLLGLIALDDAFQRDPRRDGLRRLRMRAAPERRGFDRSERLERGPRQTLGHRVMHRLPRIIARRGRRESCA